MNILGDLLIAFLATGGAIWVGLYTTRRVIAHQFRPVVRPEPSTGVPPEIVIENIGNGIALGLMLFTDAAHGSKLLAERNELPAATPGDRIQWHRTGWPVPTPLVKGHTYRLLYQDFENKWHETEFVVRNYDEFDVTFHGPHNPWGSRSLPAEARTRGLRVRLKS
ncbi:MAG: hypothetical protein Q8T13_05010 [Acidobacteriota bacterium]|nr:hypothetical protein [Acidobacteriota bacterium]